MAVGQLVKDLAVGTAGGLAASRVMTPVTTKVYDLQSEAAKKKEQEVSKGVAYNVAVAKTADALGVDLDDEQIQKLGILMHYGLALSAAAAYIGLRRSTGMGPLAAGMAAGVGLYLVVDETLNPLLGFTAPPGQYPLATHVRGLVGHVALGLTLAGVVEVGWLLLRARPS